jgi:hypothetical protein
MSIEKIDFEQLDFDQKHIVKKPYLKDFSFEGNGELPTNESVVYINGIKVGKYITKVTVEGGHPLGYPSIVIEGLLDRLDEETKTSWGIR